MRDYSDIELLFDEMSVFVTDPALLLHMLLTCSDYSIYLFQQIYLQC